MATVIRGATHKKEKITISIDAPLVQMVDTYVAGVKQAGCSRSAIFEEALLMWKQAQRDRFDEQYYSEQADAANDPEWTAITTEAAKHIWKE